MRKKVLVNEVGYTKSIENETREEKNIFSTNKNITRAVDTSGEAKSQITESLGCKMK